MDFRQSETRRTPVWQTAAFMVVEPDVLARAVRSTDPERKNLMAKQCKLLLHGLCRTAVAALVLQMTPVEAHIAELKPQFVFAPDTRIKEHSVKIQSGEWTSVIGVMEGTFSQPMRTPNGPIAPTGKTFKLQMSTVGHWKDRVMDEEYLFWDNQAFMKQIGLAP